MSKKPIGKLPDGWKWVQLGEVCKVVNQRKPVNSEPPVMSISKYDGFVPSLEYFSKQVFSKDVSGYKYVRSGQFAYSTIHLDEGSIARFSGKEGCLISPMYTTFEISEKVDGRFLLSVLKSQPMISRYHSEAQGSINRRKSIPFSVFAGMYIPLPPLPVQRWISDALADLVEWSEKSEEIVNDLQASKAAFVDLLLSEANSGAKFAKLSDIGVLQTGLQIGKKYTEPLKKYPYLRVANVKDGYIDTRVIKTVEVPENEAARRMLKTGDVLITEGGDADKLGRGSIWQGDPEVCLHQNHIFAFRPEPKKILPEYLALSLQGSDAKSYFLSNAKQTTNLASINSTQLKAFSLRVPHIVKQREAVEKARQFEVWVESEREKIAQLQKIKRFILQQLLSGTMQPKAGWAAIIPELVESVTP